MGRKASTARSDLEQMLVDENAEPRDLPLALLDDITADYSHEIGSGGFAVVYKGILGHRALAVKKLTNPYMHEKEFEREVQCLMQVRHKNVVRFMGYCSDRQGRMERYDGRLLMADVNQRLLCFEYLPKGSVNKYINDPYREWGICYKIIKGICEGVQYLHENHIVHQDLKPDNILLDSNMVPKIIDFGLSRCFDEIQSEQVTTSIPGTLGYVAPELLERGAITPSADLYSLGVVILEILTRQRGDQNIEDVLKSWSGRLERSHKEALCHQIRVCYEIALECRQFSPEKRPSSAQDIIDRLHETEYLQATDNPARGSHPLPSKDLKKAWLESDPNLGGAVYLYPSLVYLKISVIAAQDLIPSGKGRPFAAKIQMGNQIRRTRAQGGTANPTWSEEFMFVACEPFEDPLVVTVEECAGRDQPPVGRVIIPVAPPYVIRNDNAESSVPSKWFSLWRGLHDEADGVKKDNETLASKIHLMMSLETAYHVMDEYRHCMSDLQPAAKKLRTPVIGILEVGFLGARDIGSNKNPYCVAKYGAKWVRTRTLLATAVPKWNEQYTWEVFDLCTVITVAVFDNANLQHHDGGARKDQSIGKVRILLSKLESDRVYMHIYPLMALSPSGLKKTGGLHLSVRFTCTSWAKMLGQYGRRLLPMVHYTNPISVLQLDNLRFEAMQMVATRLGRAEPPLRREVVEYMLDVDSHTISLRRSKANFHRITSILSGVVALGSWLDGVSNWKDPTTTILVRALFLVLVLDPELILPTVFLYMTMIGLWNYLWRMSMPQHIDTVLSQAELAHMDKTHEELEIEELDEEPADIVRMRNVGGLETVVGDLATQLERAQSLLLWHDPRATFVFITLCTVVAVLLYSAPFQYVLTVMGLYFLGPPWLRSRNNMLVNLFNRLPSKDEMLL